MKKYHLYLWIIALAGLITSCSRDETAGLQNEAGNRVRIGASIDQALRTRAASVTIPANHKLRYVLEVLDTKTPGSLVCRYEKTTTGAEAVAFDFVLTEAGNYKALLWADFVPESETGSEVTTPNTYTHYTDHYYVTNTADGLKAVTLAKTGADYVINDDARDAFFACIPIEKRTGAFADNAELTRPFGQINVIGKNTALLAKVSAMALTYAVPGQFNVETGATAGALTEVKPAVSTLPTATTDRKANLFYDFVFAPATGQTTLGEIAMTFTSNDAHITLPAFTIPANMPVVRNKRTNISGSILQANSNDARLTVAVSDAWTLPDDEKDTDVSISTADELKTFRDNVNKGDNYAGKVVRLTANIDLANETWTTPIGRGKSESFRGTFDGGGYNISGLNVNSTIYAGLFGYIRNGTVRNLRVSGSVNGNATATASYAGGIAGTLNGSTVENCIFSGTVKSSNYVGGIAGVNMENSRIAGCHTKGTVTAKGVAGVVTGVVARRIAGGIAGVNWNSSSIDNCYSEAEATEAFEAGGIVRDNVNSTVTYCYATGAISGNNYVGGIAGYTEGGTLTGCIALNPGLTRTEYSETKFGRIAGDTYNTPTTFTSCAAYSGMTIKDAKGTNFYATAKGKHGDPLTTANCLTATTYTSRGFAEPTATTSGWAFDTATPWTYLPWNPAFESFPGISEADYRISVPAHLKVSVVP